MSKVYAAANKQRDWYRFHIHQWPDFLAFLDKKGIPTEKVEVVKKRMYHPTEVDYTIPDHWVPREDQPRVIAYMEDDGISKVVTLQTGKGKTFCALKAVESHGVLGAGMMSAKYLEKWEGDVQETLQLEEDEVYTIQGMAKLVKAVRLAKEGKFDYKFVLISTQTYSALMKKFEAGEKTAVSPTDLWKVLGIGLLIIDEAHENAHAVFKQDLYAHIPKKICLTATLESDNHFRNKMSEIIWPPKMRFKPGDFDRYIRVKAIKYNLTRPDQVRHINQQKMYSHTLFEESLIKRPNYLKDYLGMILSIVDEEYVEKREPGQKALIFCATKELCGIVADMLQENYHYLEVSRYISEDDYEVLMESDISVSTVLSAGTAVDIPGLMFALLTTSINSGQANVQIVGRLRRLKDWPDLAPSFAYLVAENIPKHVEYHEKKVKLLRPRVEAIREHSSSFFIGSGA